MDNFTQEMLKALASGEDFSFEDTVKEFVAFLFKERYSASTISAITGCIKEDVEAFRSSPLEREWLAFFIDSVYIPLSSFASFAAKWGWKYRSVSRWYYNLDLDSAFNFYRFHPDLRSRIYTNNCVEGFNKRIRRLIKKRIQFVDEESMEKCLMSICLHYNEKPCKRPIRGKEHIADGLIEG